MGQVLKGLSSVPQAVELLDNDVRELLRHYDLGDATRFEWLTDGYQSDNYTLVTDRGKYVARILYDTEARVEYILGVYEFLASRNVPTARPVRTVDGRLYVLREGTPVAI